MDYRYRYEGRLIMKTYKKLFLIVFVVLLILGTIPMFAISTRAEAKESAVTVTLESDKTSISKNTLYVRLKLSGDKIYGISGELLYSDELSLLSGKGYSGWTFERNGDIFCTYGTSPLGSETEVLQLTFYVSPSALAGKTVSIQLQNLKVSNGEKDAAPIFIHLQNINVSNGAKDTAVKTISWDTGADDTPSGGCYVATAVYGSYDCPEVWTLRRYRDETLAKTWYGRAFIHTYYAISPTLVKWFGDTAWFKTLWRKPLDRMVETLNAEGVANTPYQDTVW